MCASRSALLAVTVVVMGAPFWGNDFGGALSAAPGFALLGWLLLGHRAAVRTVWVLVGVLVAAGVVVGLLDLLRPPDQRTHVGKFFQKVGTDFGGATLVIRRKAAENLSVLGHSVLLVASIALVGAGRLPLVRAAAHAAPAVARGPTARAPRSRSSSWRCSASR